ncbi:L-ornithine N(5)-monooxygenase [Lachnellula subtilissima]|uniref:L-ornithine N(5)-monooxygenase [NAD(P)H] n=1 Tax=Lachnellula subtilissima TaxID=602034 RepID=A0A8H8RN32_9HELO|nr:L-ornithine N(5)-monooxygenase [Lachnellula subtilissima]
MAPSAISPTSTTHEVNGGQGNGTTTHLAENHISSTPLSNGHIPSERFAPASALANSSSGTTLDLLCVGFGPASLAIAIALHDASPSPSPNVLFLEKQPQFAWHAGMQLPGAKMQISFLKDLATPRDPRSYFTFVNYLFQKGRLNNFINLSTFLPSRMEYEDYLRWCASHFEKEGKVGYGMEVEGVRVGEKGADGKVTSWEVTARSSNGDLVRRKAKHVVIAVGGRPVIPQNLQGLKHVAHSSQFASAITQIQEREKGRHLRFAVLGSGQSAAEIFNDISSRFPDAQVKLVIKGASLRPSDDSPFVNEIFDPDRVDGIYNQAPDVRTAALALDRGTNYGVVRLQLLEHLYEKLYMQRLHSSDEASWRCKIIPQRTVISASQSANSSVLLKLGAVGYGDSDEKLEELEVDYVFTATGYRRNAHEDMLAEVRDLLPEKNRIENKFPVGRDYRVSYDDEKVDGEAGVWLQGCNEGTHGLSDTLLSILAIRAGELVKSIFGSSSSVA